MEQLALKTLSFKEMEMIEGGSFWRCLGGIVGGAVAGFAGSTGNGIALTLGPVGVTWGAIGAIGGGLVGATSSC